MIEQTELPGDVMKTAQEIADYVGGTIHGNAQVVSSRNYSVHRIVPQFSSGHMILQESSCRWKSRKHDISHMINDGSRRHSFIN